jgi:hypothetical protein
MFLLEITASVDQSPLEIAFGNSDVYVTLLLMLSGPVQRTAATLLLGLAGL